MNKLMMSAVLRVVTRSLPCLSMALGAATGPAAAQTAPAPAAPVRDEPVELSPFIIATERDTGWSANDTLSANRTKQALKDVPVNIDAITRDFMEDLGLDSADDVALFVANVYALPIMENDNHKGNFSFRGLAQTNNVSRNYFRWYIPSDTYNVERIDFGKGSNSLIFGEVEPGGQGAVFTKRPLLRNFGEFYGQYTNEGAYRFQLDVNRRLRPDLALRFNAVRRLQRTFQDASDYRFGGETIALAWQPFRRTGIRLEFEQGAYENVRGFAGIWVRENSARSRAFGTAGTYYTSDREWIISSTLPVADRTSSLNPSGGSPSLLEGGFFDVRMLNAAGVAVGTKRINGFPKHYNIRGSFDNHSRPFRTWSATIEQQVGPVSTELAYNYQTQQEERNDNAFDQTISVDVNGRPYIDSRGDRKWFRNDVHSFRGSAVYKFDRFRWMEQLFVAGAEYREDQALNLRWQYFNIAPALAGTASAINTNNDRLVLRLYLDDPQFYSRAVFDRLQKDGLPTTSAVNMVPLRYFASGTSAADGTAWRQTYSTSISATGRYFKGRVQSLAGARTDWGRTWDYVATRKEGRWSEDIQPPNRADALPGEYVQNRALRQAQTTYSGGLTVALNKDINLYTIYSESFRFQDARTYDRVTIGPISGVTKEIGLKGDLLERPPRLQLRPLRDRPAERRSLVEQHHPVHRHADGGPDEPQRRAARRPALQVPRARHRERRAQLHRDREIEGSRPHSHPEADARTPAPLHLRLRRCLQPARPVVVPWLLRCRRETRQREPGAAVRREAAARYAGRRRPRHRRARRPVVRQLGGRLRVFPRLRAAPRRARRRERRLARRLPLRSAGRPADDRRQHAPRERLRDARPEALGPAGARARRRAESHRPRERGRPQDRVHDDGRRPQCLPLLLRDAGAI